jgi:hypothetical protein
MSDPPYLAAAGFAHRSFCIRILSTIRWNWRVFVSIVALTILFAPDYLEPRGLPVAEVTVSC